MKKGIADVASYIAQAPAERRPALERLRGLCKTVLRGYEESIEYGMPIYKRDGQLEIAFASQKQYISLYVTKHDVVNRHRKALKGCSIGKSCIRYKRPEQIDFDVVKSLLRGTVESHSKPC
jgi:uncharacterized protein YdhG (YjbR/CyaY superfamily)